MSRRSERPSGGPNVVYAITMSTGLVHMKWMKAEYATLQAGTGIEQHTIRKIRRRVTLRILSFAIGRAKIMKQTAGRDINRLGTDATPKTIGHSVERQRN